ncbi:unnamed protein product [Rotaria sp. Silwood2]|nr:unnamed protein product [Rotaria sp. Silwood2]CAF4444986.1 unnamed protein product [Rotaria sp. Silwood2]
MFHQQFYPQSQQQTSFHNSHGTNHFFMPNNSSYYRSGPIPNQSSHHVNFSRIFEYFPMPSRGFTSMATGPYFINDLTNQQQWNSNMTRNQQQNHRIPAYYFQDKSTYYYMSEPMITNNNRITIQLTKVHIGINGDQQRVFVEQEFSNQNELRKFVKNLKQNFEKTFNNRTSDVHNSNETVNENQHTNNKKSGVVVIEEPDEEPKVYEQKVYNENINLKQKSKEVNYPLVNTSQLNDHEQNQRSTPISSCSTVCLNRRRKNKMKYYQQNLDNDINKNDKKQNQKSSNYYHHYDLPPRFQQQFFNKENIFRMTNDFDMPQNFNIHWRFNRFQHSSHNQPYSYVLPMNENLPPPTPSVFHHKKDQYYHPSTPPPFVQPNDQYRSQPSSRRRRGKKHRRNQPKTITENIVFTNNIQEQTRVHRSRSDCRPKISFQNQIRTHQYLDYRLNPNQRQFIPFMPPRAPIYYPQRRLFRNTQVHYRFVNSYRPNTICFQC